MLKEAKKAFGEKGILVAVGKAMELFDAMHARDVPTIASLLMHIKDEDLQIFDGVHVAYGQRLLSEILCLQREALSLFDRVSETNDITLVEQYLLGCGRIGYGGSEMFDAIQLRETCITAVAAQRPWEIRENLEFIKNRAFLTNLMISRDYTSLNSAVKDISAGAFPLFSYSLLLPSAMIVMMMSILIQPPALSPFYSYTPHSLML